MVVQKFYGSIELEQGATEKGAVNKKQMDTALDLKADKTALTAETQARETAITNINTALGYKADKAELNTAITTEQNARESADSALGTRIDNLATVASTGSYNDLSNKPSLTFDQISILPGTTAVPYIDSAYLFEPTGLSKNDDVNRARQITFGIVSQEDHDNAPFDEAYHQFFRFHWFGRINNTKKIVGTCISYGKYGLKPAKIDMYRENNQWYIRVEIENLAVGKDFLLILGSILSYKL